MRDPPSQKKTRYLKETAGFRQNTGSSPVCQCALERTRTSTSKKDTRS